LDWSALVPQLLESAGFAASRALSSAEFQAVRRWQQALEACGSLGSDGRRMRWNEFMAALGHALDETLFAPESRDAPMQIAGPAESAGLTADAVWFLGAHEDAWPPRGSTHPLLPLPVQREAAMPHATPQLDWELARAITVRLLASGAAVCFSYARQEKGSEARPSRLVTQLAMFPQPLPEELKTPPHPEPSTILFEDCSRIPIFATAEETSGGASVLTFQSQCPFKAFATARLGAQSWERAEAGLTAAQRGLLLHAALHAVWAGPPQGIRTHEELLALGDRGPFVAGHVERVFRAEISAALRDRLPRRYLEIEQVRLIDLVCSWLDYEAGRREFNVEATELNSQVTIAGLALKLRLDRVDRLNDGSLLVIDYKSGQVSPRSWELPRPDDVQLPLYAGFAMDHSKEQLGGLVFAKSRAGDMEFAGRVRDARRTLLADLSSSSGLVKSPLTSEQLAAWQQAIEELAQDFISGRAEVDPRDYPKTCERCGLQTLCRIEETRSGLDAEDDEEEVDDE
jgi:probable DNA repair protein